MQKSNSKPQPSNTGPSFGVQDVVYVLFKHKWKILILSLLGFVVAGVLYMKQVPIYISESKLLIRYVMAKGTVDPYESVSSPGGGARGKGDPVINTEIEILNSVDLSLNVAEAVGVERLLPNRAAKHLSTMPRDQFARDLRWFPATAAPFCMSIMATRIPISQKTC